MQHFKDHGKKPGKKPAPVGPQSIYASLKLPSIPERTEFKDYVSLFDAELICLCLCLCLSLSLSFSVAEKFSVSTSINMTPWADSTKDEFKQYMMRGFILGYIIYIQTYMSLKINHIHISCHE